MASARRTVLLPALVLLLAGAGGAPAGLERPEPIDALLALAPLPVDPQTEDHSPMNGDPPSDDAPILELEAARTICPRASPSRAARARARR